MLTRLRLKRFKNFKDTELVLGPLTTLIGSNASGKSNIRDAFRFLHGIARGYTLAEIMGERYGAGGELQWRGIRGGNNITYPQAGTFMLSVDFTMPPPSSMADRKLPLAATYTIKVEPGMGMGYGQHRVVKESLYVDRKMVFDAKLHKSPEDRLIEQYNGPELDIWVSVSTTIPNLVACFAEQPVLTQLETCITEQGRRDNNAASIKFVRAAISELTSMRFLDLNPDAMRLPSFSGQTTLGDRGENLSSVLQAIYEDPQQRKALLEWIRELTPMDAGDFEFIPDQAGKILVNLVEENGQKTSAYSASDGTLRFLAMLAALLGPDSSRLPVLLGYKPTKLYFFEELDNGLHPARLYLLLQLIEQTTAKGDLQVITTTHSPQLLHFLSDQAREYASLVYRRPNTPEARIKRILDIPDARRLVVQQDLARLHESGWFENAMFFLDEEDEENDREDIE